MADIYHLTNPVVQPRAAPQMLEPEEKFTEVEAEPAKNELAALFPALALPNKNNEEIDLDLDDLEVEAPVAQR